MLYFGLIGRSLSHSFSRNFFSAKFEAEQRAADYSLIEIEDISTINNVIAMHGLSGFNVTIPYKESIIPYLDELSSEAKAVGAVNCVVVRDGKTIGHNTDVKGIEASLGWLTIDENTKALVLGTGGASKAVQYVLRKMNIEYKVVSRDTSRGDLTYEQLSSEIIKEYTLIINATPVGTAPDIDNAPSLDYSSLGESHQLFDLVYNPATTEFLKRGEAQGANTMNGILMLQTQAIASWHIWQRELGIE
jgi:shikimate dehydrogenase